MKSATHIQRHAGFSIVAAALLLGGCVSPGQTPEEDTRPVAIATQAVVPEFEVKELDIGRGRNAGKGAGKGFIYGAMLPLGACGSGCDDGVVLALLLAPFTAAAGAVIGTMVGAASAPEVDNDRFSEVDRQAIEEGLVPQLAEMLDSDVLRDAMLSSARHATHRPLVPAAVRVDAEGSRLVNVSSGVPTGGFAHALIARLVKVNVVNRKLGGVQKLGLVLWVDVAYVDAEVPVERYWKKKKRIHHVSNYYDIADWQDEGRVREIAGRALEEMGRSIVNVLL